MPVVTTLLGWQAWSWEVFVRFVIRELDEEKSFETLAAFTDAQELAALKAGDIAPVIAARPRRAESNSYSKLTLKFSPRCEEFFTILIENVTITLDKKGEPKVETKPLTADLVLPSEMRGLIEQFADLKPTVAAVPPDRDSVKPAPGSPP